MDELWRVLIQFVFRLTFGVALAMLATSPRLVDGGFFRVHLWVLMGLNTFASLAVYSQREELAAAALPFNGLLTAAITLAVLSYIGAVLWLYEMKRAGTFAMAAVCLTTVSAAVAMIGKADSNSTSKTLMVADIASSGFLLGTVLVAMFLGHWYLNRPGMQLQPLKRLIWLIALALASRAIVNGIGLAYATSSEPLGSTMALFVAFRWLAGIVGTTIMAVMAWYTLKIPNTQSATGILYAGVIVAFLGELTSQLLSIHSTYPL